ncbi:hypothetical protein JG687_00018050 [Phytophthora cactorum]|uniref:Uncharacterized protein n=1 Tax=Phytophthora cactorum TaxID=29920 RepID=A0A8T1TQJ1_9STRA|nr:hypothetical protein JG687_00018050 [Phytophthora cactorum]
MLRKIGVTRKKILKYIWENTNAEPSMSDVHNLLARLSARTRRHHVVEEALRDFGSLLPGRGVWGGTL